MFDLSDRNVLLGMLLVQCGFLDQAELSVAMHAWSNEPHRPFDQILLERGAISLADLDALRPALDRHIARNGTASDSLTSLKLTTGLVLGQGSQGDASPSSASVDLFATRMPAASALPAATDSGQQDDPFATRLPEPSELEALYATGGPVPLSRYRKVRDHAKGGLGVVYVALDRELNREVALKEIQEHHADNPSSQSRFMLEAEITGGLEHPGIVPVYGLGSHGDGRPYYAMRFIRGDSLKNAISAFHSNESFKSDPGARTLALQKLLRRFLDVCNAIAYAHSRGVVHRDLKPDNVMVGSFGETLVVDWGLAKASGQPHVGSGGPSEGVSAEGCLSVSSSSGANETMAGSLIGTPAYMSPEQALGQLDLLGGPSDVYSLGATLYVLLTGVNPVQAPDLQSLLDRVSRGDFPPPCAANPHVPRSLEAVCLKAMALKVEDRYQTPRDLANEIERWMADEPVKAYREPFLARAARWARHHKTLVTGVLVLLMTGGLALSVGYVLVRHERDEKDRLFARSQKVVKDYLVTIANEPDLRNDSLSPVRNRLLDKAGDYYKQFLAENRDNPNLRRESADAFYSLGTVSYTYNLGKDDTSADEAALNYHLTALDLRKEQARSTPNDPAVLNDVALSEEAVANQERQRSGPEHFERARAAYLEAIALLKRGLKIAPRAEAAFYDDRLALVSHHLGTLLIEAGRRDEALEFIQQAIQIQRSMNAASPTRVPGGNLALYLTDLSEWQRKGGHLDEALVLAREAQSERDADFQARPKAIISRYELGLADFHLATLLLESRQSDEASKWYKLAKELLEPLARDYPLRTDFQSMLARVFNGLGESRLIDVGIALGQQKADVASTLGAEAINYYEQHRKISLLLEAQRPGVGQYQSDVARSDRNIGSTWFLLGQFDEALKRTLAARDILVPLVQAVPSSVEFHSDLGAAYNNLGLILGAMGRRTEAVNAFQDAITNQTFAYDRAPQYRDFLFTIHVNLGCLHRELGHLDAAIASLIESRKLAVSQANESIGVAIELMNCLPPEPGKAGEAATLRDLRQRIADLAMEALRQGVNAGFRDLNLLAAQEPLKPLRDREDYRSLVADLEAKRPAEPSR